MNQENWTKNDYQTGLKFLAEHEDEAASDMILPVGNDVIVILPLGLPLYGAGFYGIFMLAPIILFMLIISYFMFIILTTPSMEFQFQLLVSVVGLVLLWGLTKALKLLTSSRDLFRRKYFTVLGTKGISGHYSKWHFPGHSNGAIEWGEISSVRSYSTFFLPGIFAGIFKSTLVEITSQDGTLLKMPFYVPEEQVPIFSQKILDLIQQKRAH
ncbi:MAG: hypothetical protein VW455_12015 [Nitrospinota bacterium]